MGKTTEKEVKARKDHNCDSGCGQPIKKGEQYTLFEGRFPVYDENDKQNGVEFFRYRNHKGNDCWWTEECKKGNHDFEYYPEMLNESGIVHREVWVCSRCCESTEIAPDVSLRQQNNKLP